MGFDSSIDRIGDVAVDSAAVEADEGGPCGSGGSTIWIAVDGFGCLDILTRLLHPESFAQVEQYISSTKYTRYGYP